MENQLTKVLEIKLPTLPNQEEVKILLEMTPAGITDPLEGQPQCQLDCVLKIPTMIDKDFIIKALWFGKQVYLWEEPLVENWGYKREEKFRSIEREFHGNDWPTVVKAAVGSVQPIVTAMKQRQEYWHEVHSSKGIPKGFLTAVEVAMESIEEV